MSTINQTKTNTRKALVTGASSGIGAIYADRLARRGFDLILVARNAERLNTVASQITATTGREVEILRADLSDSADRRLVENRLRQDAAIEMLVNNAGFGGVTPLLQSSVDTMEEMIDLNVTALTRLTYAAVPGFVARGHGTVINISSIAAISLELLNGVYGGTKAFVLTFTQSLQHELKDKGVRVQAVLPGATATEFWNIAGLPHENLPAAWVMKSEDMVEAALAGLDAGEVVTIPPLQDGADWESFEAARQAFASKFQHSQPGSRYLAHA
ncbi:MAG TPA: SDR family oxidoreductase [Verrucomicrobiae bacterium]|nr:SDR family oxidoreductase [Verrucomicrobiae bacterium]HXJ58937.1 SDR family oxidoreductase [Verrucomicrobiae bacterium]